MPGSASLVAPAQCHLTKSHIREKDGCAIVRIFRIAGCQTEQLLSLCFGVLHIRAGESGRRFAAGKEDEDEC